MKLTSTLTAKIALVLAIQKAISPNPVLSNVSVSLIGVTITSPDAYIYEETTGEFKTTFGTITIPAADIVQNDTTGAVSVTPGVSILVVTGTI